MTDVFISYKREERDTAQRLAEALQKHGFSVWWDAELLPGERYRAVTFDILQSCRAAIVIWSAKSIVSSWVLDEAQRALDRGVLIPVHLEAISSYPLGFGQLHALDLTQWDGSPDHPAFTPVLVAVRRLAGEGSASAPKPAGSGDLETEVGFWRGMHDSEDAEDFNAYLARYPEGLFSGLARRRATALSGHSNRHHSSHPFVAQPASDASLQSNLTAAQIGLLAAAILAGGFLAWPIANTALGLHQIFYSEDYDYLMQWELSQSIFVATPLLTLAGVGYDKTVALWRRTGRPPNMVRFGVLAALIVFFLISLGMRAHDGRETQFAVWMILAWASASVIRPAWAWTKPLIEAQRARVGPSR